MFKKIILTLVSAVIVFSAWAQIKISCYSESGNLIGYTIFEAVKDNTVVYDEYGYLIGYIDKHDVPYKYYDVNGILKAEVYIESSGERAVFYFKEQQ
jgi:hypothetical protein